jgi:hypothetical protein
MFSSLIHHAADPVLKSHRRLINPILFAAQIWRPMGLSPDPPLEKPNAHEQQVAAQRLHLSISASDQIGPWTEQVRPGSPFSILFLHKLFKSCKIHIF